MTERGRGRRPRGDGRGPGRLHPGQLAATPRSRSPATAGLHVDLVQTTDVLATPGAGAAPTRARCWSASPPRPPTPEASLLELGQAKLARKGCDLLVLNEVGRD